MAQSNTPRAIAMRAKKAERAAQAARIAEAQAKTRAVVASGRCPDCGNTIYRNLSLTGWWQCDGYPSPGFRRPGHEHDPKCSWQGFTE